MKKNITILIISFQILTVVGIGVVGYLTFMNKARIRATQRVMVDTQQSLASTIAFMDDIQAKKDSIAETKRPLAKGTPAPSFISKDENLADVSTESLKGKKTLLVFSQPSCSFCLDFYPVLNEFKDKQSDVDVVIMQVGSNAKDNKAYKNKHDIQVPIVAATYEDWRNYKVQGTPTSVLIDEDGKIITSGIVSNLEELERMLDAST